MTTWGETTYCSAEGASKILRISQAKELLFDAALESADFLCSHQRGKPA
jgi:hypothetical protein